MTKNLPSLSFLGMVSIAISFGWVRYGYGLFMPHFKESFHVSTSTLGAISSLTYISYLLAIVFVGILTSKCGPRPIILTGIITASSGMMIASITNSVLWFTVAMFIAGISTGCCWSSFSDVVKDNIPTDLQERSLAVISTGATVGLVLVSLFYLIFMGEWRWIWGGLSILGFLTVTWAWKELPVKRSDCTSDSKVFGEKLISNQAMPLLITSLLFGLSQSVYWTFAADYVTTYLNTSRASGFLWLLTGIGGSLGMLTGDLVSRLGFKRVLNLNNLIFAGSIGLLSISQGWWVFSLSGLLFGMSFMIYSALIAIWSSKVFPSFPTKGFSVTIFIMTVGSIIGPALFGWFSTLVSLEGLFGLLALVTLGNHIAQRDRGTVYQPNYAE